jgi:hypothetical protein|tara:strand:+ start:514 stop:786 length:273 start_codon:yes stop_codon:yes gene_type:complete
MRIFRPHTIQGRVILNKASGTGMGAVLLDKGGTGSGSSYSSMSDYLATTKPAKMKGLGLGGAIQSRLENLVIKPKDQRIGKKKNNISFDL